MPADDRFIDRSSQLHIALRTLHAYHSQHGRYPDLEDADSLSALSKTINAEAKSKDELYADELDDSIIRKVGVSAKSSLVPMTAFFGGIIAQEIVKLTGKYSPLK
jgi:ubiquitin-activating enzyme E1